MCECDWYVDWWDRFCSNFWIDLYFRLLLGTPTWRLRYTFLKYPVCQWGDFWDITILELGGLRKVKGRNYTFYKKSWQDFWGPASFPDLAALFQLKKLLSDKSAGSSHLASINCKWCQKLLWSRDVIKLHFMMQQHLKLRYNKGSR